MKNKHDVDVTKSNWSIDTTNNDVSGSNPAGVAGTEFKIVKGPGDTGAEIDTTGLWRAASIDTT